VVRSEKLVAVAWEISGIQRKGNVSCGSHYQATASEDLEEFICTVVTVIFGVCN
jgi:hypothetical protein